MVTKGRLFLLSAIFCSASVVWANSITVTGTCPAFDEQSVNCSREDPGSQTSTRVTASIDATPDGGYEVGGSIFEFGGVNMQRPDPNVDLSIVFSFPVDSGDWNIQAWISGVDVFPGYAPDPLPVYLDGVELRNTDGTPQLIFIPHTPGSEQSITIHTSAFVTGWEQAQIGFRLLLSDPVPADPTPAPEPSTYALACAGIAGLGMLRIFRRKSAARA